jgi:hypothetical protein
VLAAISVRYFFVQRLVCSLRKRARWTSVMWRGWVVLSCGAGMLAVASCERRWSSPYGVRDVASSRASSIKTGRVERCEAAATAAAGERETGVVEVQGEAGRGRSSDGGGGGRGRGGGGGSGWARLGLAGGCLQHGDEMVGAELAARASLALICRYSYAASPTAARNAAGYTLPTALLVLRSHRKIACSCMHRAG